MLTIDRSIKTMDGYTLKMSNPGSGSRGYSVEARSLDEVKEAIDHYYGRCAKSRTCILCKFRDKETQG